MFKDPAGNLIARQWPGEGTTPLAP